MQLPGRLSAPRIVAWQLQGGGRQKWPGLGKRSTSRSKKQKGGVYLSKARSPFTSSSHTLALAQPSLFYPLFLSRLIPSNTRNKHARLASPHFAFTFLFLSILPSLLSSLTPTPTPKQPRLGVYLSLSSFFRQYARAYHPDSFYRKTSEDVLASNVSRVVYASEKRVSPRWLTRLFAVYLFSLISPQSPPFLISISPSPHQPRQTSLWTHLYLFNLAHSRLTQP